jgi:hypothetical protein
MLNLSSLPILTSVVIAAAIGLAAPQAGAVVITGPVNLSTFNGTGATYGPPSIATFTDGPITVNAGTPTPLFTGPKYANADSILLVVSGAIPAADVITLTFDALTSVVFHASDFVSTTTAGFPSMIGGIANGNVNGVVFPTSVHAGADLTSLPAGLATGSLLADVTVTQTVATNLRIDVFGDQNGLIIGNAANSGAVGIVGVPAPLIGHGLLVLLAVGGVLFGGKLLVPRHKTRCDSV